jgi:hypothetical protein
LLRHGLAMPGRRSTWTEVASELRRIRHELNERANNDRSHRAVHLARAEGVSDAALAMCRIFRSRFTRFDAKRFMQDFHAAK